MLLMICIDFFLSARLLHRCPDTIEESLLMTLNIKVLFAFGSMFQNVKLHLLVGLITANSFLCLSVLPDYAVFKCVTIYVE